MNASPISPVKKVVVIGPECTGKSDLSQFLATHFNTAWVPEYARGYIDNLVRPYQESDLLTIAHGQMRLEDEWPHESSNLLICDTNLYVIKVWSEFKFGHCASEILKHISTRHYDLYLLTYVDIPWQNDPQREHPDEREELYHIYLNEMKSQGTPFVEIRGERELRRETAVNAIEKTFGAINVNRTHTLRSIRCPENKRLSTIHICKALYNTRASNSSHGCGMAGL